MQKLTFWPCPISSIGWGRFLCCENRHAQLDERKGSDRERCTPCDQRDQRDNSHHICKCGFDFRLHHFAPPDSLRPTFSLYMLYGRYSNFFARVQRCIDSHKSIRDFLICRFLSVHDGYRRGIGAVGARLSLQIAWMSSDASSTICNLRSSSDRVS